MDITLYCQDTQASPQPVDGVLFRLYDSSWTFLTSGITGSGLNPAGEVELTVASLGTYYVRISHSVAGYEIVSPQQVDVAADGDAFTFTMELFENPTATDSNLCRVSGFLRSSSNQAPAFLDVEFRPTSQPKTLVDRRLLHGPVRARTSATGYVVLDLVRGATYSVRIPGLEPTERVVLVPDRSWTTLHDLLLPVPTLVTFTPASLVLAVGGVDTSTVVVRTSDGNDRSPSDLLDFPITFAPNPSTGITVSVQGDVLQVTGLTSGTYTVSASFVLEADGSVVPTPTDPAGSLNVRVT